MTIESMGFIIGTTLMYSAPLIFAALGATISENAGIVNIGLEGMMTMGAFVGAAVGVQTGHPWFAFFCGGLAGGLLGLLHGIVSIHFLADQVVSGIAINFIGPGLAVFLCRHFFEGTTMTPPIPLDQKIPRPVDGVFAGQSFLDLIFNQYATVYLAFFFVLIVYFGLYKTVWGLRLRAVGEHPRAADTLAVNVYGWRYLAVVLSGIFAGFGGAAMSLAVVSSFRPTLISGQGFIALAAMIFGKWKPQGAMMACLLFGAAQGVVVYLGGTSFQISSQLLAMLPYVATLVLLIGVVGRANAPGADGLPYER